MATKLCYLLRYAVVLSWTVSADTLYDCSSSSCDSDQRCSTFDGKCYDRFTTDQFSKTELLEYNTWADTGVDVSNILDGDNSTYTSIASQGRYLNVSFPSRYFVHAVEILLSAEPQFVWLTVDPIVTTDDIPGWSAFDDAGWISWSSGDRSIAKHTNVSDHYTGANDNETFPFLTDNIGVMIYGSTDCYAFNIYGAESTSVPTEEPTVDPTS